MTLIKTRQSLAVKHRPISLAQMIGQEDIVNLIKGQLRSEKGLNRSFLLSGPSGCGKCLGKGTPVLMFSGEVALVENIKAGDLLMGPDSKPRRVLSTTIGNGPLFEVIPVKGDKWVCNDVHVLTLARCETNELVDIPLDQYLKKSRNWKNIHKQVRVGVEFENKDTTLNPYFIGLWLGDGTFKAPNPDKEVHDYLMYYAKQLGCGHNCVHNPIWAELSRCKINDEKRIPQDYLLNSRQKRLQLLAGLMDTDGHNHGGTYEIITKYAGLRDDILYLSRSLGFAAYASPKKETIKERNYVGYYWRIIISGNLSEIPCLIERKKIAPRRQIKDVLHVGFEAKLLGEGEYFGFELDGDGRFLLGDFTITHNTSLARLISHYVNCEKFDLEFCEPCWECEYCNSVKNGILHDVNEINFSDSRGIDTVREIIDGTRYAPQYNVKVFILDEIQCITPAAQNALLKVLEEPPDKVLFLLLTTDPSKLLETVKNRCCPLNVQSVSDNELVGFLKYVATQEKKSFITDNVYARISLLARGHVRQALASLEAVIYAVEGNDGFDQSDNDYLDRIIGRFVEVADAETSFAQLLMEGVYKMNYASSISSVLKLIKNQTGSNYAPLFRKLLDYHLQSLYLLVDPKKQIVSLADDPRYSEWQIGLIEYAKAGELFLTHQSAGEIVEILLDFIYKLSTYQFDVSQLAVSAVLRMIKSVKKYANDINGSVFHQTYAPKVERHL